MPVSASSPSIPLLGSRREAYAALYGVCGGEVVTSSDSRQSAFGYAMPDAHMYVLNDQPMLDALAVVGAAPRLFGNKQMVPGVNVLRNEVRLAA